MSFRESFLLTKERLVSRLRSFGVSNASTSMGWASLLSLKSNTSISLDVPLNLVYSDDFLITGVLQTTTYTRIPGATVKLKVGSTVVDTGVTDNSGMFSFTRTPVAVGNHSFQVIFEGDNINNACESAVVTREVGKETTVLSVDNIPVQHYGDSFSVSGVLSDDDGVPVVNKQITIGVMLISGTEKQVTCNTDSLGRFSQVIPVYTRNIMRGENFRVHVQSMSDENFTGCSVFIDVDFYTSVFSLTSDKDIISAYDDEFAVLTANLSDTGGQGISDESVVFYTGDFDSYTPDDGYLDVTGVSKVIVLDSSHRWCGFKTQEVNGMYVRFHYDKCAGYGEISSHRGLVGYFYSPVLCVDDNVVTFVDSQGNEQTLDCTALSRNWEVTMDGLISVFSDDDVLGWGFTDSDGNCVEYYYGKGAGDLNIKAKCMNVSETYEVLDAMFYDNGTDGTLNSEWWKSSSQLSLTEDNTGITASTTSSSTFYVAPNKKDTSKSSIDDMVEWNDFICEFTFVSQTGNQSFILRDTNANTRSISFNGFNEGDVLKIKYTNNTATAWKNDTPISTTGNTMNGDVMIRFNISNGSIKFKEFKAYPI